MIGAVALGSMFAAGVAGSLHCIGMCGPILAALTASVDSPERGRVGTWLSLASYHGGRIWTYAVLGLLAGALGDGAQRSVVLGRPLAVAMAAILSLSGVLLLTNRLGRWFSAPSCGGALAVVRPWLRRGAALRVVAGGLMGLIPCGLVYAMLVAVAALRDPLSGALGMAAFGLGTVPSLSAVVLGGRIGSPLLRAYGPRVVGVALIVMGAWLGFRVVTAPVGGGVAEASCHDAGGGAPLLDLTADRH